MLLSSIYQVVVVTIAISCTTAEIICYIIFFHHTYRHDNGNVKKLLDPQITKQRNRKNLTTFLAQFYSFATEMGFLVVFLIIIASDSADTETKAIALVVKYMEFGGLCLVEIITSGELRKMMVDDLKKIKSVFMLC